MKPSPHAILWDMDGVISDTRLPHFDAWVDAFAAQNVPFSWEQFIHTFGMNNTAIIHLMMGKDTPQTIIQTIIDRREDVFCDLFTKSAELAPGIRTWLDQFTEWGFPMAIASSAPQDTLDVMVDALKIRPLFRSIVSGAKMPSKPNPDVYLAAAQVCGLPPQQAVVVEDAIQGVEGAQRAGMKCIAVETSHPAEKLKGANIIVPTLADLTLPAFLNLINAQ